MCQKSLFHFVISLLIVFGTCRHISLDSIGLKMSIPVRLLLFFLLSSLYALHVQYTFHWPHRQQIKVIYIIQLLRFHAPELAILAGPCLFYRLRIRILLPQ